jgi:hypothetical protein
MAVPLFSVMIENPSMSVSSIASAAVAANHAQTAQALNNIVLKQQHAAEQSIVQMLEQAITPAAGANGSKGVDIKA